MTRVMLLITLYMLLTITGAVMGNGFGGCRYREEVYTFHVW